MTRTFISDASKYARRYRDGLNLNVGPAVLRTGNPVDPETPGVAVYFGNQIQLCLTAEHAWNLQQALSDQLNTIQQEEP